MTVKNLNHPPFIMVILLGCPSGLAVYPRNPFLEGKRFHLHFREIEKIELDHLNTAKALGPLDMSISPWLALAISGHFTVLTVIVHRIRHLLHVQYLHLFLDVEDFTRVPIGIFGFLKGYN